MYELESCIFSASIDISGEFLLRLRQLEKSLLSSLNEVKGRILDDDSIITHLETLKKEAEEIAKRFEETDLTMAEVESTSQQYIPLAQACSSIYFTLESLNQVQRQCIQMQCWMKYLRHSRCALHQVIKCLITVQCSSSVVEYALELNFCHIIKDAGREQEGSAVVLITGSKMPHVSSNKRTNMKCLAGL
jgi:hypothetical protein